jgi:hypothetical protein
MISVAFSVFFISFLLVTLLVQFWLGSRHIRHILQHRAQVPAQFAEKSRWQHIRKPPTTPSRRRNWVWFY